MTFKECEAAYILFIKIFFLSRYNYWYTVILVLYNRQVHISHLYGRLYNSWIWGIVHMDTLADMLKDFAWIDMLKINRMNEYKHFPIIYKDKITHY